uniref:Uncharacterized protein n=1 Tax=Buteo japonicus TaxID=224669 RepID=A0A8B9Z2A8_9AVES
MACPPGACSHPGPRAWGGSCWDPLEGGGKHGVSPGSAKSWGSGEVPQLFGGPRRPSGARTGSPSLGLICCRWRRAYGRSPVCARSWITRYDDCLKAFPQVLQTKGRSPVCTRSWEERALDCLKPLPQSGQTKGRSPTPQTWGLSSQCWRWWRRRALEVGKSFPHSQRKGRSSVWTSRWLLKSEWRLKEAWQRSQRKGRSSLCTTSWLKSSQARLKAFSQTPHWKGFSSTITSRISSSLTPLAPRFGWAGSPTAAASSSSPTVLPSTSLAVE